MSGGRVGGEEEEGRSWDFPSLESHSSSYRPWEGSELLLRGYYANPSSLHSSGGYRCLDDRLPSFESQFNEGPPGHAGHAAHAAHAAPPQTAPPYGNNTTTTNTLNLNRPPEYTPLPYPNPIESKQVKDEKILLRLHGGSRPSSSSLDTHPTLVSQLTKKSSTESPESSTNNTVDNPGQVAAISSTEPSVEPPPFKCPPQPPIVNNSSSNNNSQLRPSRPASKGRKLGPDVGEKSTKKKRKRCGECSGCQKKDNCGDCAPCRNEKSHQICKVRRCERLIEKKPKKANVSSELTKLSPTPRTAARQITELHQPAPISPHFSAGVFNQTPPNMTPNPPAPAPPEAHHWISQQNNSNSSHQPNEQNWSTHYTLSNHQVPVSAPAQQNSIFEAHHFDSFIRRPSQGLLLSPLNAPTPNRGGLTNSTGYHEIPSTSSGTGFLPLNGNGSSPLGYNLAVNTETKPYHSRSSISPQQGNSQPGFPTRPYEELILPSYKPIHEGLPGEKRTGVSPDSTTAQKTESKSFLCYEPQNSSATNTLSTANNNFSSSTSKLISNELLSESKLGSLFLRN